MIPLQYETAGSVVDAFRRRHVGTALTAIALFAVLAVLLLLQSKALVPYASIEAESGATAGGAAAYPQALASGGSAVQFAGTAAGAGQCTTIPAQPAAKPTVTNTGVPAGTVLSAGGDITAGTAGQVISGKQVTGSITVTANNVTIQNSKISMTGYWAIRIMDGVTGTRIINNELYSANGGYTGIGGGDGDVVICGNYIHHFENGITTVGPAIIQANLIEKLQSDSAGAHYDAIELYAGSNSKVWGNNLMLTDPAGNWRNETGAINMTATWGAMNAIDIAGNWMGGGSYTLYIDEQGYSATNVSVTNNVWYGTPPAGRALYGPALVRNAASVNTWTNNTWENGTAIPR